VRRTAALLACAAALAACRGGPRPLDPGIFLLPPAAAGFEGSLAQEVSFEKGETRFESTALLEVSKEEVILVGLSPLGTRMITLRWDGRKLVQERAPSIPKALPLELILRDVQLASWPAEAVRAELPGRRWTLEDAGSERTLLKDGRAVVRIRYGGADRRRSDLEFEHLGLGYRMRIHPLPDDEEGG